MNSVFANIPEVHLNCKISTCGTFMVLVDKHRAVKNLGHSKCELTAEVEQGGTRPPCFSIRTVNKAIFIV